MKIIYRQGDLMSASERHVFLPCAPVPVMMAELGRRVADVYPEVETFLQAQHKDDSLKLGDIIWQHVAKNRVFICAMIYTSSTSDVFCYQSFLRVMRKIETNSVLLSRIDSMRKVLGPLDSVAFAPFGGRAWDQALQFLENEVKSFQPVVYETDHKSSI